MSDKRQFEIAIFDGPSARIVIETLDESAEPYTRRLGIVFSHQQLFAYMTADEYKQFVNAAIDGLPKEGWIALNENPSRTEK